MQPIDSLQFSRNHIKDLAQKILRYKRSYYAGKPEISDEAFDQLEDQLRKLEPEHPVLHYVGTDELPDAGKALHETPMLSLQKVYDLQELRKWVLGQPVVGLMKIDGNSLSLIYRNGHLVTAKTRGNGKVGEDVTEKIKWVAGIPASLTKNLMKKPPMQGAPEASTAVYGLVNEEQSRPSNAGDEPFSTSTKAKNLEIRGELYCHEESFFRLVDEMVDRQLERPTSPRNIVAGILGRKAHIDLCSYFDFMAFDVLDADEDFGSKESQKLAWLNQIGFEVPRPRLITDESGLMSYLELIKSLMNDDTIGIDGAVFVYEDLNLQKELGSTAHHPRYKMSFKWQGETAVARILGFSWATSRHGVVTPVAIIEPTVLSNATITNVTLHNAQFLQTYQLKPGDSIEIVRSGEVIPKFLRVIKSVPGNHEWQKTCPSCQKELYYDGIRLICKNTLHCPAQHLGTILNWIKATDIEDLSEKRLNAMIDLGLIKSIPDLYRLNLDDLLKLPLTKETMAKKLLTNIQKSKTCELSKFLLGLGVPGMGLTSWEKLLTVFPSLDLVLQATSEEIAAIEGFAEKTSVQVFQSLQDKSALIRELIAVGVTPYIAKKAPVASSPMSQKQIALTGKLSRPREDFERMIKDAGGSVTSSVSNKTFAVVTDDPDSNSSKMKKARELGVPIWSEGDLLGALQPQEN